MADIWTKTQVEEALSNFRYNLAQSKLNSKNDVSKESRRKQANKRTQISKVDNVHVFNSSKVDITNHLFSRQNFSVKGIIIITINIINDNDYY